VATFCNGRGLASSSFFAWKRRLAGAASAAGGFASAAGGFALGAGTGFAEARVVGDFGAAEAVPPIELELLGGGRRVVVLRRGFDAWLLRGVLMALEGERP